MLSVIRFSAGQNGQRSFSYSDASKCWDQKHGHWLLIRQYYLAFILNHNIHFRNLQSCESGKKTEKRNVHKEKEEQSFSE